LVHDHPILKRRAGVLIPLSSILTNDSFECGDIASLLPLGHWAKDAGFSIIQILPLNDTGIDTSPYSSISAFAIDPIYISLSSLGSNVISRKRTIVTNSINHFRIREQKVGELRRIFDLDISNHSRIALEFLSDFPWAYGYATFRVLYDMYEGKDWSEWKKEHQDSSLAKEYIFSEKKSDVLFYVYMQSIAYSQLKKAKEELETIGVYLKGDMPILTSRNSADVWEYPEYFDLNLQAGAPPDAFSEGGQNWGFPVLNWPELRKTNFRWWKERITYLDHFFHLYRIDHVIGMYRIWAIPKSEKTARKGWFHPQRGVSRLEFEEVGLEADQFLALGLIHEIHPDHFIFYWDFWKDAAYQRLPEEMKKVFFPLSHHNLHLNEAEWKEAGEEILDALERFSGMIACAEDLGSVPGFIRDSLQERETLGIDVIRWTRSLDDGSYIPADGYRETAISVLSTHDTSLAMDWWNSLAGGEKEYAERFFFTDRKLPHPEEKEEVMLGLLDFAFSAKSLFSIQMLQDLLFKEEYGILEKPAQHRVNVPGTENNTNWTYRFKFTIEELSKDKELSSKLRKMILESERI
jgi:4-alpha-glucanotransferase